MRMYEIADKPRVCKAWRSYDCDRTVYGDNLPGGHKLRVIMHYSTEMLSFYVNEDGKWDGNVETVNCGTGYGSVSDQNGMNKLFARLGMPFYFQRAGGAQIVELDKPQFRYGVSV